MSDIRTDLTLLTQKIDKLLSTQSLVIIAIDGRCTAGKTTLAAHLGRLYDCNIFHMDDFFLTPELRTAKRLNTPGGNVDYERFRDEVLMPLRLYKPFSYHPYDCHSQSMSGLVNVLPKPLNIIEGTYSMHPELAAVYDLSVFLNIGTDIQRSRILKRDSGLHENFFKKWIPMEEMYFSECRTQKRCGLVLENIEL